MSKFEPFFHKNYPALLAAGGLGLVFLALALTGLAVPAFASPAQVSVVGNRAAQDISNESCLFCHQQENLSATLPSGETMAVTIVPAWFEASVHGQNAISCVTCHSNIDKFPHPENPLPTARDRAIASQATCQQCHSDQFNQTQNSAHQKAIEAGNKESAVCADCHNPHAQKPMSELSRAEISQTCASCHSAIYGLYEESVHGSALLEDGNPDVPTCIDCHGAHAIEDPTAAAFRVASPTEMCGRCHANAEIMDRYGISTQVLDTYVSDFHGTTIAIFARQSPDQAINQPVCFDCHGVHDIKAIDDPEKGLQVKENILVSCQKCHPDATTTSFTDAWLGHYIPDAEKHPIVYYVNLFYSIFIPAVIGPMVIFVISDFARRMIDRKKGKAHS